VLGVVVEQRVRKIEDLDDALVGDPVVNGAVLAAGLDEAAPAQTGEMGGDLRLRQSEPLDQLADRELNLVAEQLENAHSGRIAEPAEVLGDKIAAHGRFGKADGASTTDTESPLTYLPVLISELTNF
jgi:hypothetical protein